MEEGPSTLPQHYQVNVVILEGRHLAVTNASTEIRISIGKWKKKISAKSNKTDSPYYNDFCLFNFYLPLNVLLDEIVNFKVYQTSRLIRKLVGSFNVELSTVWSQPNHQFYHKWAVLADPKNPTSGVKGFLKCDIVILTKGNLVKTEAQEGEDDIEENLLVPFGAIQDRHRARVIFSVFRADSFSSNITDLIEPKLVEPYVKITYGGFVRKTNVAKSKDAPVWNEELIFPDLFPPLCQNILVEICDRRQPLRASCIANTNIDIRSLYENGENGFLPTFGPNFLYLYQPYKKRGRHRNCCVLQGSFTYYCRLLIAMRTEILSSPEDVKVQRRNLKIVPKIIPPLIEDEYFEYNKFILFAAIFDVLFFDAKYFEKSTSIRITFGPKRNTGVISTREKPEPGAESDINLENQKHVNIITTCNTTPNEKCNINADYSFITFAGKYPCVHVFGEWPNLLRRMYRSNIIKKAIQNCTDEVNEIKYNIDHNSEIRSESYKKVKGILAELSRSCEDISLLTDVTKPEDTNLYRERKKFYRKEIAEIVEETKIASGKAPIKTEDALQKISAYLATLTKFANDPENSFPDTEIWLRKNNKITAQYRIRTEDVVHSSDLNERGFMSGKTQTIIIEGDKRKAVAKVDIFVWFGLAEDFIECLKMLPAGFKHDHKACPSSLDSRIPSEIIYEEAHHFQCRAHIFQAKIFVGFDETGLADTYIRIILQGENRVTQVRKATLSPVWDETLVLPQVTLYGPSEYIKKNSRTLLVEAFDRDKGRKSELIGRCLVKPVVKLNSEKYEPPAFPPRLKWESIKKEEKEVGQILIATELLELSTNPKDLYFFSSVQSSSPLSIPEDIRPHNAKYRLEVIFWGVRQLKKKNNLKNKVFVTLECGEKVIKSPVLKNVRHKLNFPYYVQSEELKLPEEPEFAPPLSLKLYHIGSITSRKTYVATCIVPSVRDFFISESNDLNKQKDFHIQISEETEDKKKEKSEQSKKKKVTNWLKTVARSKTQKTGDKILTAFINTWKNFKCKVFKKCDGKAYEAEPIQEIEKVDWWVRYHTSVEGVNDRPDVQTFKVYREELEAQPEFGGLEDFLHTFNMVVGHEKKTEGGILMAKVKAALKLYKWSYDNGETTTTVQKTHPETQFLTNVASNDDVKFVLRVYIICARNLTPKDVFGKSDPYLVVQLGEQTVNDRKNYAPKQLNPVFGKCFEFKGIFPRDYLLHIKVIDYDATSNDDLIGETSIDIENRYYSKHHASCGIAKHFVKEGPNAWKDIYLPTDILSKICQRSKIRQPIYQKDRVVIDGHEVVTPVPGVTKHKEEIQALRVLNRWHEIPVRGFHLVPEHIETRSLYHPSLPGIEQGKLEMWVDVFPADFAYMPPKVNITSRPPVPMEVRAIVWNVDHVILDDKSFIFSEKMSDIYVKGWILSLEEDMQRTDVHYRSLNGEGNFNWRFIFRFNYIATESRMVVKKQMNALDLYPEERKSRCKLELQVWDNDVFGDDYLGTLILELCSMPRGAKLSSRCTLKMLAPNAAKINLFKIRKTRGWWPFRRLKEKQTIGNEFELTGKIDLELEVLTEAEALRSPAGKGREEPDALPPPTRPATSFNWMVNIPATFRYIIWRNIGRAILLGLIICMLVFFLLTALYAFPNYLVKKLLNA